MVSFGGGVGVGIGSRTEGTSSEARTVASGHLLGEPAAPWE